MLSSFDGHEGGTCSDHLFSGGGNITTVNTEYQPGWVSTMFLCIIRCLFEYGSIISGLPAVEVR
jgi:hypothetical protein